MLGETNLSRARAESLPLIERRAYARSRCGHNIAIRPADEANGTATCGRAVDLSAGGVGLLVRKPFAAGTPLELTVPDRAGRTLYPVRARVVCANPLPPKSWLLGCIFETPLAPEVLRDVLP